MMTPLFRVVLILVSVGTLATVLKRIQKAKLAIEDSIFWILLALMFVVFALFPAVPDALAALLGIYSTANFLFLFMIFVLLMRMFSMSMRISLLEDKLRKLVQELALREKEARDRAEAKETTEMTETTETTEATETTETAVRASAEETCKEERSE